jgi:hypothetical protein
MAEALENKTISTQNTGFPEYLDFGKLRSSAIAYLGKLAGKIWTDHNVHDPGITILETLIYAVLDLGYRTNLPVTDLFTRDPEDGSKDNNFFTPSRILANNPLTITDYRKLLVDLQGIKNAWLEIEDNPQAVNGLYHVYVQLEEGLAENGHHVDRIRRKIRRTLMAHRNLCEDFIDIQVLCTLELGLCAEIELEEGADPEDIYLKMVTALRDFFSPAPRFYSLQQLLEKQVPVEEIFAGRPFNVAESHGFIDTEEFEQLKLRKELHLTDVYHVIFDIAGIKSVRNLGWIRCCEDKKSDPTWKLELPENHIPAFSTTCSGFTFTRNGLPVKADLEKFDMLVEMKFPGRQKSLYTVPSSYLDAEFPGGNYHSDLADYYSIQNEFPHVYGIKEGGLAGDVSDRRKAQALQLQGFLLFFDQLLANYLASLKNIRSLFALTSAGNTAGSHTYFTNRLTNAPQLQELLRFKTDPESESTLGPEGSMLAYPVDRKKMQALIDSNTLKNIDLEGECGNGRDYELPPYLFCFAAERDQAVNQLREDLLHGDFEPVIVSNENDCFFFYQFTSSSDFVLISKRYYKTAKDAANAAVSVKYTATFAENYRRYIHNLQTGDDRFSFSIELNLGAYARYLELIVEDRELYLNRRQEFQQHLLSRFAEQFADYALLSSGFLLEKELQSGQISARDRFLGYYDDISSNRGKAYDYARNKWGNYNISGFEKRFKALSGIGNWKKHFLCNFIVDKADKLYRLSIDLFNTVFEVTETIMNEEQAMASLQSVYRKLADPRFELVYVSHEEQWQIAIPDEFGNKFVSRQLFREKEKAVAFDRTLTSLSHFTPDLAKDIRVTKYIFKTQLTDHGGALQGESRGLFPEKKDADEQTAKVGSRPGFYLNDKETFSLHNSKRKLDKLLVVPGDGTSYRFIDEHQFSFKPYDVIHLKREKKKFSALNRKATIQFDSLVEFDTIKQARDGFRRLLVLLASAENYTVSGNKKEDDFRIIIGNKGQKIATYFESFASEEEARKKIGEIIPEINATTFNLFTSGPIPNEWEFIYRSMDLAGNSFEYVSQEHFSSEAKVIQATNRFYSGIPDAVIRVSNKKLQLILDKQGIKIRAEVPGEITDQDKIREAKSMLKLSQELYLNINNPSLKEFNAILNKSRINPGEDFVYKLVDRDNPLAVHIPDTVIADEVTAENEKNKLIKQALSGYVITELNLSGDAVHERKDPSTRKKWYHFTLKCSNRKFKKGGSAGKPLVLFESTKGFLTREEALQALHENYLNILKYARLVKNYGEKRPISLREILIHTNDPGDTGRSIVFVPDATQYEFNGVDVPARLAALAASYPVWYLRKNKYRFVAGVYDEAKAIFSMHWRSNTTYGTEQDALFQFRFFLVLLKYPGNFYTEWNKTNCRFHIYIREVLAISAHGFSNMDDAWGAEGVEKFICTAQSREGFHNYLNRQNCSNSFYVACGDTGLIHPCTYDTPKRRDIVLDKLYRASGFNFTSLIGSFSEQYLELNNLKNEPVARINLGKKGSMEFSRCEWLLMFVESVNNDKNFVKTDQGYHLIHKLTINNQVIFYPIAQPYSTTIPMKEWAQQLRQIACYFPVVREEMICNSVKSWKYYVRINLPGFERCESRVLDDPCIDRENGNRCEDSCRYAWESNCCFDTCNDAMEFYARSLPLLAQYENYKPVYDCSCGAYRVELHPRLTLKEKESQATAETGNITNRLKNGAFCSSEIVAINPQAYDHEKMACDAAERAKKLINSEGLHLVEHILLRPRCSPNDTGGAQNDCNENVPVCYGEEEDCTFRFVPGGEPDSCDIENNIHFTPGYDPYSFISTVALPAWPERFREPQNRQRIEKLLHREAPAHVLLRILWLNPRDLFLFESTFKAWNEWLARKICDTDYSTCDFLKLLFRKKFDSLHPCTDCLPCSCGDDQSQTCFDEQPDDPCDGFDLTGTINNLYCWGEEMAGELFLKEKTRTIRSRSHTYEKNIRAVAAGKPDNRIAANALIFLNKTIPVPDKFSDLITSVIREKPGGAKGIRGLTKPEKKILMQNLLWKYLDLVSFTGGGHEKINSLAGVFEAMRKSGLDMNQLFEAWDSKQVRKFEQGVDPNKILNTLTGK